MDVVLFLAVPLAAALIYVGIHAYIGLHILARGVIFVDLALAQIATIGISAGIWMGYEPTSTPAYAMGFAATAIGAALFAWMRNIDERIVPHEALIGISYVVASGAMILVLANTPHGSENIKTLLVGAILWITWEDVGWMVLVYGAIGLLHWHWRARFIAISFDRTRDRTRDMAWDFVFYLLFGIAVTSSVRIAGVLLVFSFLIIPGVMSAFFAQGLRERLALAWALGGLGAFLGIALSFLADLPTGAAVVCVYGLLLGLTLVIAPRVAAPLGAPRK